jgi:uncharacterized membrane protein
VATVLAFVVLVALICQLAPRLARPELFFGVTVRPGFPERPEARAIARGYASAIWFMALVAGALVATDPAPLASGPVLLGQMLGASLAFVRAHRAARPFSVRPAAVREADLGTRPSLPGGILVQAGPFLLLLAAAVYVAAHWPDVPDRFPIHWNLGGRPDGWATKTGTNAFRGLALGIVICGMMLFQSVAVLRQSRLPRVTGREGVANVRVRRVTLLATLATEYVVALLIGWTHVMAMFAGTPGGLHLPLAFRVAPFALALVGAAAVIGVRRSAVADGPPVGDTTPDAQWIFGTLYLNRRDPALFVEKRAGFGYTLNLGNPRAWLVVIVCISAVGTLLLIP